MKPLRIASVVEGFGEVAAVPELLRRLAAEIAPDVWTDFPQGRRKGRDQLIVPGGIESVVDEVVRKTRDVAGVLVLIDADDACPAALGPELLDRARGARPDVPLAVVLANREFEAWFLASAVSLRGHQGLPIDLQLPSDPERPRDCKGWLTKHRVDGTPYNPVRHQTGLTARFDLAMARKNSPSFDKFWRDVEYLITGKR
ncbi:DUF4276 family protein [Nonomuraea purpurea]|uniref:DUF4276 family protein n=1 Tax=Nonomuraea purpurea TaxID=1849276 RepID=A0ABV8G801_9ACTN